MEIYKSFEKKQQKLILIALICSLFAVVLSLIYDSGLTEKAVEGFNRPKAYEKGEQVDFEIEFEGGKEDENLKYSGRVGPVKLGENEIKAVLDKALDEVEKNMFKEGESAEKVITGIYVPAGLRENPASISFTAKESGLLLDDGSIDFTNMKEKTETEITITATYGGNEERRSYNITLLPKEISEEERLKIEAVKSLDSLLETGENAVVDLPTEILGHKVKFVFPKEKLAGKVMGFALVLIVGLFVTFNEGKKKKIKDRDKDLKDGYADFIGRFVILLGAGLSVPAVWKKLETGLASNLSLNNEIKITLWEVGNGKTEREAYENFGRRIGRPEYIKFASILNQSLKMGSGQILTRLETESETAMNERRNMARSKGEEADTRMLMPMMLQLVLIMIIIMIPALMAV